MFRTSFRIGIFEDGDNSVISGENTILKPKTPIIYHQDGGGNIKSVETVIYVMLEIPDNYQKDVDRLIKEFRVRYGKRFANSYDFNKPDPKHITIAHADLTLTDRHLRVLTKKMKRPITLNNLHQDKSGKTFTRLTNHLEHELNNYMTDILLDQFENLPDDTTASCYPSRFNLYGKFIVVQYKPDLGFHALIVPAIKDGLEDFFEGRGKIVMGKFYQDTRDVMLHISIAKEKRDSRPNKGLIKELQSNAKINYIPPGLAKNFTISYEILNSFKNPVWVSLGSYGTFK